MKLFITGASGFVGASTVRSALGYNLKVLVHGRPGRPAPRLDGVSGYVERLEIDLSDEVGLTAALRQHRPDAVIHLAWSGVRNTQHALRAQFDENLAAACSLARAAAASGITSFLGMGSQGEYGRDTIRNEYSLPQPTTPYGASKVAAYFLTRQIAMDSGMRHVWMRLFSTYGPDDNDCWLIPTLIRSMLAGQRPEMTLGTQSCDWLHVDDTAEAILATILRPDASGIYNLGSGIAMRVRDVAEMIRDLAAPGMQLVFGERAYSPDQIMFIQANIARLRADVGWEPRIPLREGLMRTVDWYRANMTGPGQSALRRTVP